MDTQQPRRLQKGTLRSLLTSKRGIATTLGLFLLAGGGLPGTNASGAPPSIFFQCLYLDNALTYLGYPSLAPVSPSDNPSWCCGLDKSTGDAKRTVVCTGNETLGNLAVSEVRWTNSNLTGQLASLRPTWLSNLKILNLSGNKGLTGPFPTWLQDTDNWNTLISLNLDGCSLSGPVPDLSYHKIEYLYLRGNPDLKSQIVTPWFMRQCFLNTDIDSMCFASTAYIPPACAASGSVRCPANTTLPTATPAWVRWTCIDGYNTPVRLASDGEDQVPACMTTDGKTCIFTETFEQCQVLAAIPKPNALPLTCGQKFAEVSGASGYSYSPETWCTAAFYALNSPAIIHHWPFAPVPPLSYTCVPGINTPLTIIPETGETACMLARRDDTSQPGCLWFENAAACQAAALSPPPNVDVNNAFSCGNWYKRIYGWDGYDDADPNNWCSAGRRYLYVNDTNLNGNFTLFPTATATTLTSIPIPTETLTGTAPLPGGNSPFYCISGVNTPIRVAPNGQDVACMSLDGYLCYWLTNTEECQAAAGKGDESTSYLSCGAPYDAVYGTTDGGYYPGSWCTLGKQALIGK